MRKILLTSALMLLILLPCALRAEEMEIPLMEVVEMGVLPGDNPLDDANHMGHVPTRPTNFRATINGNSLTVLKQEEAIPFAQAIVVSASTGSVVINRGFTSSLNEQIANAGVYVLRIETAGGALIGQFRVQ